MSADNLSEQVKHSLDVNFTTDKYEIVWVKSAPQSELPKKHKKRIKSFL